MAKFIKSIFNTGERRKSRYEENEEEKTEASPPLDGRRKLSISRSGRMKANKKRLSLSLEVYGQETQNVDISNTVKKIEYSVKKSNEKDLKRRHSQEISPEEEIDNAFEIIDKS